MEQPTTHQSPFKRSPFEIVGECFSIYGRHFRSLILIALIIQIPLSLYEFAIADSLPTAQDFLALSQTLQGDPRASLPESAAYSLEGEELPDVLSGDEIVRLATVMTAYAIVTLIMQTFVSGVIVAAVGMQYAVGRIDVGRCYGRAWWRVLTLVILGLLSFGLILLMALGFALLIVPGIVMLVLIMYWSVIAQAAVIEGCKPIAALRRSFELVRGNWWRTFATLALIILVSFGLTIILTLLFAAPTALIGGDEGLSGFTARVTNTLTGLVTNTIIMPIVAIGVALIYLNLRARKEEYDIETLSQEMGITPT